MGSAAPEPSRAKGSDRLVVLTDPHPGQLSSSGICRVFRYLPSRRVSKDHGSRVRRPPLQWGVRRVHDRCQVISHSRWAGFFGTPSTDHRTRSPRPHRVVHYRPLREAASRTRVRPSFRRSLLCRAPLLYRAPLPCSQRLSRCAGRSARTVLTPEAVLSRHPVLAFGRSRSRQSALSSPNLLVCPHR
jgi:hypothetical protein